MRRIEYDAVQTAAVHFQPAGKSAAYRVAVFAVPPSKVTVTAELLES
jgi:hypothetical protein